MLEIHVEEKRNSKNQTHKQKQSQNIIIYDKWHAV